MPRSLWSGSLSFGLVNVPVRLETAVRDLDLHFRQLHEKDGAPIEVQRFCSEENVEVPYEEITHGYELDDGGQVIVSDLELEAIAPRRTRTIEIAQFVDLDRVDPIYFDHPYFLVPAGEDDGTRRAYRLLVEVMSRTDRAALGRFVMRAKEYLALVRVQPDDPGAARRGEAGRRAGGKPGGALTLTTMLFADEVRPVKDVESARQKSHKPTTQQVNAVVAVIEELSCSWDPDKHKDRYRERLRSVVQRKRKGETVKVPDTDDEPEPSADLMDALERTLAELTSGEKK